MAQEYFMVFARPIEGKDDELVAWWDRSHIPDVLSIDGFSSAMRLKGAEGAPFPYCLIYKVVEGEEEAARALLQEAMGKFGPPSPALDLDTVQSGFFTVAKEHAAKP